MSNTPSINLKRSILIWLSAITIIIVAGLVDGFYSARWSIDDVLLKASNTLLDLPTTVGEWESEAQEVSPQVIRISGATALLSRRYTHQETGQVFQVSLLCGPHGPISLHPPTVCFTGAGWRQVSSPSLFEYPQGSDESDHLWRCRFQREYDHRSQEILTAWGWSTGSGWRASENPRFEFAGKPYLFKMYVTELLPQSGAEASDEREQFVNLLCAQIEQSVFSKL